MPKRYKKGNRKKKKIKPNSNFFDREREINLSINSFISNYYNLSYPPEESEYDKMNQKRLEIKRMFDIQGGDVYHQGRKRRRIYYEQLDRFKYYYVAWKRLTYYIFLERRYGIPKHHCHGLSFFKRVNHDVNSIRFLL